MNSNASLLAILLTFSGLIVGISRANAQTNIFKVNFSDSESESPEGWLKDFGEPYGPKANNLTYGWLSLPGTHQGFDLTKRGRYRDNPDLDIIQSTLIHAFDQAGQPGYWEITLPNGEYEIEITVGDAGGYTDSQHTVRAEGQLLISPFRPKVNQLVTQKGIIELEDGRLTLDMSEGENVKLVSLSINKIKEYDWKYKVNFQTNETPTPEGYLADIGLGFDFRQIFEEEPLSYGWLNPQNEAPFDNSKQTRYRRIAPAELYSLIHMQKTILQPIWEIQLPNGKYRVKIVSGDNLYVDSHHIITAEDIEILNYHQSLTGEKGFREAEGNVDVADGNLTIKAMGINTKICYLWLAPLIEKTKPAAGSKAQLVLENMDHFPANNELTFSRIQVPWRGFRGDQPVNANHDQVILRLHNQGLEDLIISEFNLNNPEGWEISQVNQTPFESNQDLPLKIAPNQFSDLTIKFIQRDPIPTDSTEEIPVKVLHDTLSILSNDNKIKHEVVLHGLWQRRGEGTREPTIQQIIDTFGFRTQTGFERKKHGNDSIPSGDEIIVRFWEKANPAQPIYVRQMAAYHGCCSQPESFRFEDENPFGSRSSRFVTFHIAVDAQSLLPRRSLTSTEGNFGRPAEGSFPKNLNDFFNISVLRDCSNSNLNPPEAADSSSSGQIGIRVWEVVNSRGNIVPDAYIMSNDYLGTRFTNYDYNDNVYYVSNLRPIFGKTAQVTLHPGNGLEGDSLANQSAIHFTPASIGKSTQMTLFLSHKVTSKHNSIIPQITINQAEIIGEDAEAFQILTGLDFPVTLNSQEMMSLDLKYSSTSTSFQKALLRIQYNDQRWLEIPLFGNSSEWKIVKRIKAAQTDKSEIIVDGLVWESDISYRVPGVGYRLDNINDTSSAIQGTDWDSIYRSYMSSNANLRPIAYQVPLPNGKYNIKLHFSENFWTRSNQRVNHIEIEEEIVFAGLDIYRKAAGMHRAVVKDFLVNVEDGLLDLRLIPLINRPSICAIEIYAYQEKLLSKSADMNSKKTISKPERQSDLETINIYPNPLKAYLYIQSDFINKHEKIVLKLEDLRGKTLFQTRNTITLGERTLNQYLSGLQAGIYLFSIRNKEGIKYFRLVK